MPLCLRRANIKQITQMGTQGLLQHVAPLTIVAQHPPQMPRKMVFLQKVKTRQLLQNGNVGIDEPPHRQ